MSTLYGNEIAVKYARTHAEHNYPDGAILALVTCSQHEDPRGRRLHGWPGEIRGVSIFTRKPRPIDFSDLTKNNPVRRWLRILDTKRAEPAHQIPGIASRRSLAL